jgi:hypothetical protein
MAGRLSEDRRQAFDMHCSACPTCSALVEEHRLFEKALAEDDLSPQERRAFEETKARVTRTLFPDKERLAGIGLLGRAMAWVLPTAAVIVAAVLLLMWSGPEQLFGPLEPVPFLPPPMTRGPFSQETWEQAREAWDAGDIRGACGVLERAVPTAEAQADLYFYLGYCNLALGHVDKALNALEVADRSQAEFPSQTTKWFLAIAYDRAGRKAEACATLRAVEKLGGGRAKQASGILEARCPPEG